MSNKKGGLVEVTHGSFIDLIERRRLTSSDMYNGGERRTMSLAHLLTDWDQEQIQLPPHQRELSWSETKQRQYITTICSDSCPPGCIELYQLYSDLTGRKSCYYLNDGCQRLHTARDFSLFPGKYGVAEKDARYILRDTTYPVTIKVHRSHSEALRRYQTVNSNLPLTPYQLVVGDLIYCEGDDYRQEWRIFVDDLHEVIARAITSMGLCPYPNKEVKRYLRSKHRDYRHNLSLYMRFISTEKTLKDYNPGNKITLSQLDSGGYFERDLARYVASIGLMPARQKLTEFQRLVENETAMIQDAWRQVVKIQGNTVSVPALRWLYDVAIWRRNNNTRTTDWTEFLRLFLLSFQGRTAFLYEDENGKPQRAQIGLSRVNHIPAVCRAIGFDYDVFRTQRKTNTDIRPPVGFQISHIEPFATNGEGDVVIEPGSINMARGAKPI